MAGGNPDETRNTARGSDKDNKLELNKTID